MAASVWWRRSARDGRNGDINDNWAEWIESCESNPKAAACSDPADPNYVAHSAVFNRTSTRQRGAGAGLQWFRDSGAHRFAVGAEFVRNRTEYNQFEREGNFDANRIAIADPQESDEQSVVLKGKSRTVGLYATDVIALTPKTHLTVSGRWNQTRVTNDLGSPAPVERESFTYSKFNPALGVTHAFNKNLNVFASVSQGTRVPTSAELGCADPAQPCTLPTGLQADPYLKQVVARTIELGARGRFGNDFQWSSALFRTTSDDDIVFVRSGISQAGYFTNIGDTLRQGLELSARWRSSRWRWHADYTWLRATYESSGVLQGPTSTADQPNSFGPGTRLAGLPQHLFKLGGDWRAIPALRIGADLLVSGSQVVAGNESGSRPELGRIGGSAVVNSRVSWQIDPRWQAYLRVNNVFDRRYASYGAGSYDYFPQGRQAQPGDEAALSRFIAPGAPRSFWVGIRYEWDK